MAAIKFYGAGRKCWMGIETAAHFVELVETESERMIAEKWAFQAAVAFETVTERDAFVACFPKLAKVKAATIAIDGKFDDRKPLADFNVSLSPDLTTGEVNETGVKRVRAYVKGVRLAVERGLI